MRWEGPIGSAHKNTGPQLATALGSGVGRIAAAGESR